MPQTPIRSTIAVAVTDVVVANVVAVGIDEIDEIVSEDEVKGGGDSDGTEEEHDAADVFDVGNEGNGDDIEPPPT